MVRGWLVANPRRARPPRSRSKDSSAFSSVTLLAYRTPENPLAKSIPQLKLTRLYLGSSRSSVVAAVAGAPRNGSPCVNRRGLFSWSEGCVKRLPTCWYDAVTYDSRPARLKLYVTLAVNC